MPKATVQSTSSITGAPAPRPLSQWVEHLKRRKIAGRKARGAVKRQRAVTKQRLATAEHLIADIIASSDVIAQGAQGNRWGNAEPVVFVLLTLHSALFNDLGIFGSELEDTEDTHDAERTEADEGEHDLGRTERIMQPEELGTDDAEPSLGATMMVDQRRWAKGPVTDLEGDPCDQGEPDYEGQPSLMATTGADLLGFDGTDREADACDQGEAPEYPMTAKDQAIIEEARSRYETAAGAKVVAWPSRDPLTGKAGAWLLQRRAGGAK
jgi:hypothetical protein